MCTYRPCELVATSVFQRFFLLFVRACVRACVHACVRACVYVVRACGKAIQRSTCFGVLRLCVFWFWALMLILIVIVILNLGHIKLEKPGRISWKLETYALCRFSSLHMYV